MRKKDIITASGFFRINRCGHDFQIGLAYEDNNYVMKHNWYLPLPKRKYSIQIILNNWFLLMPKQNLSR